MFKAILSTAVVLASLSASAQTVPADIVVKCTMTEKTKSTEETLTFKYGVGQKLLKMSGAEKIIVEVSDDNAMEEGLQDIKVYLKGSIVSAKAVSVSEDQTHGVHVLKTSGKITSIFCGI